MELTLAVRDNGIDRAAALGQIRGHLVHQQRTPRGDTACLAVHDHEERPGAVSNVSAWWVKGPLLIAVGLGADLWRRRLPLAFATTGAAVLSSSLAVGALKDLFDRARPPVQDAGLRTLVPTPDSPSFPSGHAATTFAAATAIGVLCPRLRYPALALACSVGLSRMYLRVHFPLDVVAGAAVWGTLGLLCGLCASRLFSEPGSTSVDHALSTFRFEDRPSELTPS